MIIKSITSQLLLKHKTLTPFIFHLYIGSITMSSKNKNLIIIAPFDFYHSFQCIASKNFSFIFSTIPIYNCLLCLNCYISDFYNLHQNTLEINFIKWSNRNSRNAGTIFSRIWSSLQVIWICFATNTPYKIKVLGTVDYLKFINELRENEQ